MNVDGVLETLQLVLPKLVIGRLVKIFATDSDFHMNHAWIYTIILVHTPYLIRGIGKIANELIHLLF